MTSLVNAFQGFVRAPSRRAARKLSEAEERWIVFAVLMLFLFGAVAVSFYVLAKSTTWP